MKDLDACTQFTFRNFDDKFFPEFSVSAFGFNETFDLLSCLDPRSGSGIFEIPAVVFKACAEELKNPITELFTLCLINKRRTLDWKEALVRPHFKGRGVRLDPDSYRPISVLPPVAKIFETLLSRRILGHFESNKLFSNCQFGFGSGLSCEHSSNVMTDYLRIALDQYKSTLAIFFSFEKSI